LRSGSSPRLRPFNERFNVQKFFKPRLASVKMSVDEEKKERFSAETTRDVEAPTVPMLPTTNPALEEQKSAAYQLPAAAYVVIWISLSSSIIIFNKWILDTAKFRTCSIQPPL
jgi:hypothetical protein